MNVVVIGILLLVGVFALFLMQGVRQLAPWEQAVIQRGSEERLVKGPSWVLYLKGLETIRVLDCGERNFAPRIERCSTLDGKRGRDRTDRGLSPGERPHGAAGGEGRSAAELRG